MKTLVVIGIVVAALAAMAGTANAIYIGSGRSSSSCCGPEEWEAMAMASAAYGYQSALASRSLTGRLSVSHVRNIAALYLFSELVGNVTIVVNDSQIFFYFMLRIHRQQVIEPICKAIVLQNVVADLTDRCFPDNSDPLDRLRTAFGSLPVNLIAYEYAGLAGLAMAQLIANKHDCSPLLFAVSAGSDDDGPQFGVQLSNVLPAISDSSVFDEIPAMCLGVNPLSINMRGIGGRVGLLPIAGKRSRDQWINDVVALYILKRLGGNHDDDDRVSRHRRDLRDLLGLEDHRSGRQLEDKIRHLLGLDEHDGSTMDLSELLENAVSLRLMLQALDELIGDDHNDRGIAGLLDRVRNGGDSGRRGGHDDHNDDDVADLVDALLPYIIINRLRDSRNDDYRSLIDLVLRGGHDDGRRGGRGLLGNLVGGGGGNDDDSHLLDVVLGKDRNSDGHRSLLDMLLGRDDRDSKDSRSILDIVLGRDHDSRGGPLDVLIHRRDDDDKSDDFVDALVKLVIATNVLSDGRRPMDEKDIRALCVFLVEMNVLDTIDHSHSRNDQLKSLLVSVGKIRAVQNLLQSLKRATLLQKLGERKDDGRLDDVKQLLRLAVFGTIASDKDDHKPDFSALLKLMLLQQQHSDDRRGFF